MRTTRVLFLLALVALVAALLGCSSESKVVTSQGPTPDQQAIESLVNQAPEFEHDVVSHSIPDTTAASAVASAASAEAWFWWRHYASSDRSLAVNVHEADTIHVQRWAEVQLTTTYYGLLHVVHRDAQDVYTHRTRPITDVYTQTGELEQLFAETTPNRGWVVTRLSNIVGGSPNSVLSIQNLGITLENHANRQYTSQDFDLVYDASSGMIVNQGEQVNLLVQSGAGSNDIFRHDGYVSGATREAMINMDLGYYANQHNVPTSLSTSEARRLLVIDVIAPGVINASATYDALIWAVPYSVDLGGQPN